MMFSKIYQKVAKYLVCFGKKVYRKKLSTIGQSGHTGNNYSTNCASASTISFLYAKLSKVAFTRWRIMRHKMVIYALKTFFITQNT